MFLDFAKLDVYQVALYSSVARSTSEKNPISSVRVTVTGSGSG